MQNTEINFKEIILAIALLSLLLAILITPLFTKNPRHDIMRGVDTAIHKLDVAMLERQE